MAIYTVHVPDDMQKELDAEVSRRKAGRRGPNAEQLQEAVKLAKTKGQHVANEYLRELRGVKVSRMGVTLEMLELGLAARAAGWKPARKVKQ